MKNTLPGVLKENIFISEKGKKFLYFSAVVSFVLFVLIWLWVSSGTFNSVDTEILKSLRTPDNLAVPAGPAWCPTLLKIVTLFGNGIVLLVFVLAGASYLYLFKEKTLSILLVASSAGGAVLELILKEIIKRPRPDIVPYLIIPHFWSFPSGHAVMSVAVYVMFFIIIASMTGRRRYKILILSIAVVIAILIGFSRIYLGVHYPTDVIAGWSAGCLWVSLCLLWYIGMKKKIK